MVGFCTFGAPPDNRVLGIPLARGVTHMFRSYRQLYRPIICTHRAKLSEVSCKHSLVQALFRGLPSGRCLARFCAGALFCGLDFRRNAENARKRQPRLFSFSEHYARAARCQACVADHRLPHVHLSARKPIQHAVLPSSLTPLLFVLPIETALAALKTLSNSDSRQSAQWTVRCCTRSD